MSKQNYFQMYLAVFLDILENKIVFSVYTYIDKVVTRKCITNILMNNS